MGIALFVSARNKVSPGLGFFLIFILYFIFNIFIPFVDQALGIDTFFGFRFASADLLGLEQGMVYAIGLSSVCLGYFLYRTKVPQKNKSEKKHPISGIRKSSRTTWSARVKRNGVETHIGSFRCFGQAVKARRII